MSCLCSDHSKFRARLIFFLICGLFIFESCSEFLIFSSHFTVITLVLVMFSGVYLSKFIVFMVPDVGE